MNKIKIRRIQFVILLSLTSVLIGILVLAALKKNVNLFFTPSEVIKAPIPTKRQIRVGGLVKKGSVYKGNHLDTQFIVTDNQHEIYVSYQGILPTLFKEGQGIVVGGLLTDERILIANEVLAKHDENYMPPAMSKTLIPQDEPEGLNKSIGVTE